MIEGIIQDVEEKAVKASGKKYMRVKINDAWMSCWKPSMFQFLVKGCRVEFEIERKGDFDNVVNVKTVQAGQVVQASPQEAIKQIKEAIQGTTTQPRITATVVQHELKITNPITIVNSYKNLMRLCRTAVRIVFSEEIKANPGVDVTSLINCLFIQVCKNLSVNDAAVLDTEEVIKA